MAGSSFDAAETGPQTADIAAAAKSTLGETLCMARSVAPDRASLQAGAIKSRAADGMIAFARIGAIPCSAVLPGQPRSPTPAMAKDGVISIPRLAASFACRVNTAVTAGLSPLSSTFFGSRPMSRTTASAEAPSLWPRLPNILA